MLLCAEFVKFNMLQSNLSGVLGEVQLVGLDLSRWSLEFICSYVSVAAVREALAIVNEEGLEQLWARHLAAHNQLWEGLSSLGLKPFVEKEQDRWGDPVSVLLSNHHRREICNT